MILLAALLALGQATPGPLPSPTPLPAVAPGFVRVALATSDGEIVLDLDRARAPVTTANFLRYVDQHRLDGTVFYRTVKVAPDFGFVQFGVQNAPRRVLPPIAHEPTTQTGIRHLSGTISVARNAPGSAQGDFTISVGDQPSLDAGSGSPPDNLGYAAFGHVVEGMGVVTRILDSTAASDGKGPFPGQMIAAPVRIVSAARVKLQTGSGGTLPPEQSSKAVLGVGSRPG